MRGLSLLMAVAVVLIIGYLAQRGTADTAYTDGETTTEHIEKKLEGTVQQYQDKLSQQAQEY